MTAGRPYPSIAQHEVGRRLRQARELTGISLRQLAKRVGLSASALSQIETGSTQPSVRTLYALAVELALSLDDLLDNPHSERRERDRSFDSRRLQATHDDPVLHKTARARLELDSGVRLERLTKRSDPRLDFMQVTYEPGSELSAHGRMTRSGGVEFGVVLSGQLELTIRSRTYRLGPGDSVSLKWAEPHLLANRGSEPVSCVWVILPDGFDQASPIGLRSLMVPSSETQSRDDTVGPRSGASGAPVTADCPTRAIVVQ